MQKIISLMSNWTPHMTVHAPVKTGKQTSDISQVMSIYVWYDESLKLEFNSIQQKKKKTELNLPVDNFVREND